MVEWNNEKEFPDELNSGNNRFSVDVLVFVPSINEHTVAWYDFEELRWVFLCNENLTFRRFMWRYFTDDFDRAKYA